MAELVGGALLSGFLNVLFDRLASQEFLDFFREKKLLSKLLNELKITLLSANVLLNDAEEKRLRDPNVKTWLEELKEVLYEADYVMDKINTEALRIKLEEGESGSKASKFLHFVPTMFSPFDNAVKSEIQEILATLKHLLDQTEFLGLKNIDKKTPSHSLDAPLVEEHDCVGRVADKQAVVELLLSDDACGNRITVLPIVGMGGIGKTTLAQLVYEDSSVQEHFELRAWVTVSEDFDVFKITKIILETITNRKCETGELHQLQNELKKALMGKKFLFVHDDVWNEKYELWDLLKSSFEYGSYGSKIIVTTRSKIVALKMGNVQPYDLQTISDHDCWRLFAKHVFNNTGSDVHLDLLEIGKEIVRKCKGLPLAVKSMAGLLRSTTSPEEWKCVLQSNMWKLQNQENYNTNIIPALWLSYHFLPPQLKRCFAYFSIFPKDYKFDEGERKNIILTWMADGLLQPQEGKRLEDVGEEYWNALISRSFFQRGRGDEFALSMHDLMHDIAIHVSGEFCFEDGSRNDLHNLTSKTRYLSYGKGYKNKIEYGELSKAKYLRSLLALPLSRESNKVFFSQLSNWQSLTHKVLHELLLRAGGYLRALSLSESCITELPETVGKLKHLRYLDLSWTKVKTLPSSICTLNNLQTLLLSHCQELTELPTNISNLINLRHLMIRVTALKEMPPQMCNMTNLQTLSDFILSESDGSRIKELGELQLLHGSLCISGLENVKDVGDVIEGNLKNKKHLSKLILRWDGETNDSTKEREVLNALQPHVNLKELKIIGYRGTIFPNWVADPSYCNLAKFSLTGLKNCCFLPSFKQLGSLRELHIERLDGIISIHDEFGGVSLTKPFQFLVRLQLLYLNMWDWSFINGGDTASDIFPCLKGIELDSCKELSVGLPAGYLPSLEEISISKCNEMVAVFPTSSLIDAAYPSLKMLRISSCSRLESFSEIGLPPSLKELYIMDCDLLLANRVNWNLQRLCSLVHLRVSGCYPGGCEEVVDSFPEEGLFPTTLRNLEITHFKNLKALNGKGFQHLTSLQYLYLNNCEQLECLPAEGLPLTLTFLEIDGSPLLKAEDWPKIQQIPDIIIEDIRIKSEGLSFLG